ncbi:PTS sugar transporter subunit IIC [Limosilactobacillus fermentum]|uniref:PTS sugar transporter subunit IIC n=1 Tax=Limosilactobacillus fermentum TaxID=1613 RepID=UPI002D79B17E|nr:PTS sugar transporter subunit IIC [Limosilactobacillus fermentum]WRQ24221.1 PTS sugar transporter subunit IIC [Limosilactobacillus fermentum]
MEQAATTNAMNRVDVQEAKKTVRDYAYNISAAIANAILVTLGMGLLMQTVAGFVHWQPLFEAGTLAQALLAPALGLAVASQLEVTTLVTFSTIISATVAANAVSFVQTASTATAMQSVGGAAHPLIVGNAVFSTGQPVSAVAAALLAALLGKWLSGKTPLDMVLVPMVVTFVGTFVGFGLASVVTPALTATSAWIAASIKVNTVLGSMVISAVWALFLMTPASSAALAVALTLDPISAAAAAIGTTAQFVGYTAMSWRQNTPGANIAQFVVTPKVQFPNLILNPWQMVPALVAAIVCAPLATTLSGLRAAYTVGGLGLNSFIAPIYFWGQGTSQFVAYVLWGIVMPAVISVFLFQVMKKFGLVKDNQLHLDII